MDFLNTKSWHVTSLRAQEKKFKAEKRHEEEMRKLEELRRQRKEEDQMNELRQQQIAGGHVKDSGRIEWMYQAQFDAAAKSEEYLLGAPAKLEDLGMQNEAKHDKEGGLFLNSGSVNPVLDLQSKVRDDPLLAMQHAEKSSLKSILDNPVRMKKLQALLEAKRAKEGDRKLRKEVKKLAKKEAKLQRKLAKAQERGKDVSKIQKKLEGVQKERLGKQATSSSSSTSTSDDSRKRPLDAEGTVGEAGPQQESSPGRKRSKHEEEKGSREERGKRNGSSPRRHHRRDSPPASPSSSSRHHHHHHHHNRHSGNDRHGGGRRGSSPPRSRHSHSPPRSRDVRHHHHPGGGRFNHHRHRRPQLSEEERERRLAEMQGNAALHAETFEKRVEEHSQREQEEEIRAAQQASKKDPSFLRKFEKDAYMGDGTLEDRIRSQTHFIQRGRALSGGLSGEQNAFKRH